MSPLQTLINSARNFAPDSDPRNVVTGLVLYIFGVQSYEEVFTHLRNNPGQFSAAEVEEVIAFIRGPADAA